MSRLTILALAIAVSPLGAAVCEVVCGTPVHAAHRTAPAAGRADDGHHHDHHAHHAQHAQHAQHGQAVPAPAPNEQARLTGPAADCPPLSAAPARLRASFDPHLDAALAASAAVAVVDDAPSGPPDRASVAADPPDPPHHAPVPLRI